MNTKNSSLALVASLLLPVILGGCAGAPSVPPIDDALLAQVPHDAMASIDRARAARDTASDQFAIAKSASATANKNLQIAAASLKTARSRLEEVTLVADLAKKDGTETELQKAMERHKLAQADADYCQGMLTLREGELELADLRQSLANQEQRLSLAAVELAKAEALQDVDLVATKEIPIKDYRKVVTYYRESAATLRGEADSAAARLDEARGNLEDQKRQLDELKAMHPPAIE